MKTNLFSVAVEGEARTPRQKFWLVAKIALGVLALAIVVALALLRTWPPLLIVQTGSMEPTIEPGDIVIMGKLDGEPQVGDIVQVTPPQSIQERLNYPEQVIHRIVQIKNGNVYTKGDARDERDPWKIPVGDISAHVVGEIPGIGQIVAFFTSPLGLIWIAAGALLFLILPYFELRRDQVELEKAELSSLSSLRLEVQEMAHRMNAERGGGSRAPPGLPATVESEAVELDDEDEFAVEPDEGEFDFEGEDDLEAELEEMKTRMDELVGAVGEYGEHLRSHTEVLKGMSAASQDLAATVAALRGTLPAAGAAADSATHAAERILAQWRLRRAEEIAGWMGFHDAEDAARLAVLDDSTDDQDIEAALYALAAEKPYLRKT